MIKKINIMSYLNFTRLQEKSFTKLIIKKLICGKKKLYSGRNNEGRVTMRHRGGQHKRILRIVNLHYLLWECYGLVIKFFYDCNRTAPLMLICYLNGILSYHLAIKDLKLGDLFFVGNFEYAPKLKYIKGITKQLFNFFEGSIINNIELIPKQGGCFVRAAGTSAHLLKIDKLNSIALLRLPSKEERLVSSLVIASMGQIANYNNFLIFFDKAGRKRHLGRRPYVRGVAMNPIDHPHGGGQGKTKGAGGFRSQVTFKGKVAKTQPTRKKNKKNNFIIKLRSKLRSKLK